MTSTGAPEALVHCAFLTNGTVSSSLLVVASGECPFRAWRCPTAAFTNPANSGVKTTEFFATIGGLLATGGVTLGIVSVDQQNEFANLITAVLTGFSALGIIFGLVYRYIQNRHELKMKMLEQGSVPTVVVGQPVV